jgi:hypothetical protein
MLRSPLACSVAVLALATCPAAGGAGTIGAPAVAHIGGSTLVAWAARGGGVAVSVDR